MNTFKILHYTVFGITCIALIPSVFFDCNKSNLGFLLHPETAPRNIEIRKFNELRNPAVIKKYAGTATGDIV